MTATEFREWLYSNDACEEGHEWANGRTLKEAWATCPRADWMLWLLRHLGYVDDRTLRELACWFARQAWLLLTDPRSRAAVEVAERFSRGNATEAELTAAREDAWNAAEVATAGIIWNAAESAAAAAAWAAACDSASRAADMAASWTDKAIIRSSSDASSYAARRAQADKLRELIPWSAVEEFLRAQLAGEAQ